MSSSPSLSLPQIAIYALPALPMAALGLPLTVYVPPLYAEDTLLTLGLVGTLFSLSKIVDVITDPLFGWLSDRIMMPLGRRRSWVLISVPILMLSTHMLFNPPDDAGVPYLLFWLFVIYVGYTMILLSHLAWGAELGKAYDDRSRILGIRQVFATAGMLSIMVLPAIGEMSGLIEGAAERADLMSTVLLVAFPLTVAVAAWRTSDPLPDTIQVAYRFTQFLDMLKSMNLRRLLAADLFLNLALGITGSLYVWLAKYVFLQESLTSLILVVYFGAATFCVPIWMALAIRYEKHTVFVGAMLYGMVVLCSFMFGHGAPVSLIMIGNILYGAAFGAGVYLARAMVADAADEGELTTGRSQMGAYFSGLTLTGKIGFAFGPAIAYNFLENVGFDPNASVEAAASNWLLFTFVVPPALMLGIAGWIMRGHKLTRAAHAEIRQELGRKAEAAS